MGAETQISQLVLEVSAQTALAQRSLNDLARVVQTSTGQMNTSLATMSATTETRMAAISRSFTSAKVAMSGLFAAAAVGLIGEQIKKSLEYAGSIAEVARTLGVTTKDLQTFRYAATQTGVAQDQLEVGLRRLTVSMGKAELGSKAQAKAFGAIGISLNDLKGKDTGEVFRLMSDGLSKVTDRAQRAAIEMTLMGRSGSTLDNLLAPGSKRLNELADAAQQLGIVLSDERIQRAEETAHKLEAVKTVLAANIAGIVADNAGAILGLANALERLTSTFPQALQGWRTMIAEFNAGAYAIAHDIGIAYHGGGAIQNPVAAVNQATEDAKIHAFLAAHNEPLPSHAAKPVGEDLPQIFGGGGNRRARKPTDHGLADAMAQLDAATKGQLALAAAYQVSDAAALIAQADEKAQTEALQHHANAAQLAAFKQKELAKIVADSAAEGAKKLAQLRDETATRKDVNDKVAAGTLSYREMNRAMQDEAILQPLLTAQAVATGDAYDQLTSIINGLRGAFARASAAEGRSAALAQLGQINDQHRETMAMLAAETRLTATNRDQRDEILKLLQEEAQLRAEFPGMTEQEIRATVAQTAAEDALRQHLDQVEAGMDQLRQTGESMIDTVFNIDNWKNPLDLAIQLVKQLEQEFVTLAFANPLKNKLFGEKLPTLDSVGGIGGFAKGISGQGLSAAGATLTTASAGLTSAATVWQGVALQLQAAAAQLAAAGAASGGGGGGLGGLGGILGLLGGGGGAAAGGAAAGGDIALSGLYDDALSGLPGLASGGWMPIGGNNGIDRNVLSLNGEPLAMVSSGEKLAVFPSAPRIRYPRAANSNMRGGDTYHVHIHPQDTGDPLKNRQTGMQYAAGFEAGIAARRRKGLAG